MSLHEARLIATANAMREHPEVKRQIAAIEWDNVANGYDPNCGMRPLDEWRALFWAIICPRQIAAMYCPCQPKPAPVAPQLLQDKRDVQAVIRQTADTLADPHHVVEKGIAASLKAKGAENIDELMRDIKHAMIPGNWEKRANPYGVVMLVDNCWLRKGKLSTHLECAEMVTGVIIDTKVLEGEAPVEDIRRSKVLEWLTKRKDAKGKATTSMRPFLAPANSAPTGLPHGAPVLAGAAPSNGLR